MKSNLTEKLLSICGSADKTYGYTDSGNSITKLTEEQRVQVEAELIKHFEFDKIIWMELPSGLTEDKTRPIVAKSIRISDSDNPTYKHKVGYVYTLMFTPKVYDPLEMHQPVKDGCVFAPIIYNPQTFEPTQSITLTWSPELSQDTDTPQRTYEDDKQMIREMLEKVLENPEEYRPVGHVACLVRYATT
jgi:hypothetical protein